MVENCALHNNAGLESFYSLCNESELHFVRRAGYKYIIMNYTQGGRQVQLQTLWIEQSGGLVIVTLRNTIDADKGTVSFWYREDSKADCVILHPCLLCNLSREEGWDLALSGGKCISSAWIWSESKQPYQIYISPSAPPWKRKDTEKETETRGLGLSNWLI